MCEMINARAPYDHTSTHRNAYERLQRRLESQHDAVNLPHNMAVFTDKANQCINRDIVQHEARRIVDLDHDAAPGR